MSEKLLTILLPCLNEVNTVAQCVARARKFLDESGIDGEVVVADNGSVDGSINAAELAGARIVHVSTRGYGAALSAGAMAAKGKYIIMGDSDGSYDFSALQEFVTKLQEGFDLVMGNRFLGTIEEGAMPWKNRHIGNPILSSIGNLLFTSPVGDFHCGLRACSKEAFARLQLRTTGMEFASEMVVKATLKGLRITEVPTNLYKDGRGRSPHLRPWRDGWRHLKFMLLLSPRWLFFYPGVALLFVAVCVASRLVVAPIQLAEVVFDTHTFVFAVAAIFLANQAIGFAILAQSIAANLGIEGSNSLLSRLSISLRVERSIALGAVCFLSGLALALVAVFGWAQLNFGDINDRDIFSLVLAAVLLMVTAAQIILCGFLNEFVRDSAKTTTREQL